MVRCEAHFGILNPSGVTYEYYFVIVRFLMKSFNTTDMDIINNCRQYFDVTLWSDRVRRFEKKFAECDNIFWQNFSLNSTAYIYLLVKFLFCLFFSFFHVFCYQLW